LRWGNSPALPVRPPMGIESAEGGKNFPRAREARLALMEKLAFCPGASVFCAAVAGHPEGACVQDFGGGVGAGPIAKILQGAQITFAGSIPGFRSLDWGSLGQRAWKGRLASFGAAGPAPGVLCTAQPEFFPLGFARFYWTAPGPRGGGTVGKREGGFCVFGPRFAKILKESKKNIQIFGGVGRGRGAILICTFSAFFPPRPWDVTPSKVPD